MSKRLPAHYPITHVCMVSDGLKCPPDYDLLMRSHDQKTDCDLWRESMLKRTTRYLCFTRVYPPPNGGANNVLTGLMVLSEKELAPPGFALIEKTIDSGDKACKKKLIYVKMSARETSKEAIIDIILLTKSKRAPEGYTLCGDVNGVLMCYKLGPVPLETQSFKHATASTSNLASYRPAPPPPVKSQSSTTIAPDTQGLSRDFSHSMTLKKSDNHLSPVHDIPFQLHSKHQNGTKPSYVSGSQIPQILYRSMNDIKSEYDYSFGVERSLVGQPSAAPMAAPRKRN